MKFRREWLWIALILLGALWLGRQLADSAADTDREVGASRDEVPERPRRTTDSPRTSPKSAEREETPRFRDDEALEAGAMPGQRTITFADADAMAAFLASLEGKGVALLGRIDRLNTVRVGFLNPDALDGLLDDDDEEGFIYPARIPGGGTVQDGAVGFGRGMLEWLGVRGDRTGWGRDLTIAVLDTGIAESGQFRNRITRENLVELPDDPSRQNGHGTAVASLIASQLGLAPDAALLDYRIADDEGFSDTFMLADAIMRATDRGADLVNISLGSYGRSIALQKAVDYAAEAGVVLIASAGNDGADSVAYPAAFDNVVGVGSVDARGSHLDFSNRGDVTLTAPGLDVTSAWVQDQLVNFSGTSASAPIISGAVAAVMSRNNLTAASALELLIENANEGGAPGDDSAYGAGMIDLGRVERRNESGLTDLALASNHLTTDANGNSVVQVTVENRGTTQTVNSPVTVNTPNGTSQLNVVGLAPGDIRTFDLPVSADGNEIRIDSSVEVTNGPADIQPENNQRVDVFSRGEDEGS